jgi:hypothetical protein
MFLELVNCIGYNLRKWGMFSYGCNTALIKHPDPGEVKISPEKKNGHDTMNIKTE